MANTILEQLDLFKLLRLEHLTEAEKDKYVLQLTEITFKAVLVDDMPKLMSQEDIARFNELAEKEETALQAKELLYAKIPNFDELVKEKMLILKKELVRANINERLDINKAQAEEGKTAELEKEREELQKTLEAIEKDDWDTVAELVK